MTKTEGTKTTAPYGTWRSPLTADDLLRGALGLAFPSANAGSIYWMESRPAEGGRCVIVRRRPDGRIEDCLPAPFNARSRVHEYGGACYTVAAGWLYFVNFSDQRIYALELETDADADADADTDADTDADAAGTAIPQPLTPADGRRWADLVADPVRPRLLAVGEEDTDGEPRNFIAAISLEGTPGAATVTEVAAGHDFFAAPRLSPDGANLSWLSWDHPAMPWDGTTLWCASLDAAGQPGEPRAVAGGNDEAIFQPEWLPDGRLVFVTDRSGWWNLAALTPGGLENLLPMNADFGLPLWQFGMRTWTAWKDRIACTWHEADGDRLGLLDLRSNGLERVPLPYTQLNGLVIDGASLLCVAAAPDRFPELVRIDPASGRCEVLRSSSELALESGAIAVPEALDFAAGRKAAGRKAAGSKAAGRSEIAYGYFYRPAHPSLSGPADERPPLLVMSHGGPTAATAAVLNLKVQFWTSRGFAVLDVNYRGSTGYGRAYRDRLKGGWGVVDVEDCIAGARYLVERGEVDPERLAIRGSSAGGYTTLAALTFHDLFRAGASLYGVGDLEALARDTHKFESRYLDSLIGPWPQAAEVYRQRSPIHHVEQLQCPVIFLQGLEDRIVPPSQAETMVAALEAKGLPVAYVAFEGEQHGFRQAANIRRALEAELYFYGRIFGFTPADAIEPVPIRNLESGD